MTFHRLLRLPLTWILSGILLGAYVIGCETTSEVGEEFVSGAILDVIYVDSFKVELSTVIFDSLVTSQQQRLLVGHHQDEYFGNITAQSYFMISDPEQSDTPDKTAQFDYAEIELKYDGYYYYDTLSPVTIRLYPLSEQLELDEENVLYNTSSFSYDQNSELASITFNPRPLREGVLTISITNEGLFQEIFELTKTTDFDEYFDKIVLGFVVVPDTSASACILGFSVDSGISIHYTEKEEEKTLTFPISSSLYFNQITGDRSATSLQSLTTQKEDIPSEQTGGYGFLQGGAGLSLKVQFPGLSIMREWVDPNFIFAAYLELSPVKDSYSANRTLPTNFEVYLTDKLNRITSTSLSSSTTLNIDNQFDEATYYRIDITNYLKYELSKEQLKEEGLLLVLPEDALYRSLDQVVINTDLYQNRPKLKLYLLDYATQNN